jgi:Tfp pilus assembly ATPase PilU
MNTPIELSEFSDLLSARYLNNVRDFFVAVDVVPSVSVDGNFWRASDELIAQERTNTIINFV